MSEFSASLAPVPSGYRRRYTVDFKRQVVQESMASGASIAGVAMAHGLNANQLHNWRWQFRRGDFGPITEGPVLLPVQIEAVSAQAQPEPAKIVDGQDLGVSLGHIELIFPGARVVVHGAADLPTLRCLVQALRE